MMKNTLQTGTALMLLPLCLLTCPLAADDMPEGATGSSLSMNDMQPQNQSDDTTPEKPSCQPQMSLKENNPNDPTSPPRMDDSIAAAETTPTQAPPSALTKGMQTTTATIATNTDGSTITLDNGMVFSIPKALKKKAMQWSAGDKVTMEKGRRDNWYRIVNTTRGETLRARLQSSSGSASQQ